MNKVLLGLLVASAVLAASGQILLKLGATGRTTLASFANGWIASGLFAYFIGTALWVYALSRAPLTVVYPFTALTFVLAYTSGALILREPISHSGVVGVLLILSGLYLATR